MEWLLGVPICQRLNDNLCFISADPWSRLVYSGHNKSAEVRVQFVCRWGSSAVCVPLRFEFEFYVKGILYFLTGVSNVLLFQHIWGSCQCKSGERTYISYIMHNLSVRKEHNAISDWSSSRTSSMTPVACNPGDCVRDPPPPPSCEAVSSHSTVHL